jgi:hypothetical protein
MGGDVTEPGKRSVFTVRLRSGGHDVPRRRTAVCLQCIRSLMARRDDSL